MAGVQPTERNMRRSASWLLDAGCWHSAQVLRLSEADKAMTNEGRDETMEIQEKLHRKKSMSE
jgi:hypothetical protein